MQARQLIFWFISSSDLKILSFYFFVVKDCLGILHSTPFFLIFKLSTPSLWTDADATNKNADSQPLYFERRPSWYAWIETSLTLRMIHINEISVSASCPSFTITDGGYVLQCCGCMHVCCLLSPVLWVAVCTCTVGPLIIESHWAKKRVSTGALGALDDPPVVQTKNWKRGWVPVGIA